MMRRAKRRGRGRNFDAAKLGEAPEAASNLLAYVVRAAEGAEQAPIGVLSGVRYFTKRQAAYVQNAGLPLQPRLQG